MNSDLCQYTMSNRKSSHSVTLTVFANELRHLISEARLYDNRSSIKQHSWF